MTSGLRSTLVCNPAAKDRRASRPKLGTEVTEVTKSRDLPLQVVMKIGKQDAHRCNVGNARKEVGLRFVLAFVLHLPSTVEGQTPGQTAALERSCHA